MRVIRQWLERNFDDPQVTVLVAVLVVGFLVLTLFGGVLAPLLISVMLAYLLDSLALGLQRRGIPRFPAAMSLYLLFLMLFLAVILVLSPLILQQVKSVAADLPKKILEWINELATHYEFIDQDELRQSVEDQMDRLQKALPEYTGGLVISGFRGAVVFIVYLILIPILVFFMLKDKERILAWLGGFLPAERKLVHQVWDDLDRQIGNYIRGKMWEILIVGAVTFLAFRLLGLQYAPLLAVLVGLSVVIPYVGATLVTFPVAMVALSQFGFGSGFLWVMVSYLVIQALDGNLLVPLLFAEVVKLHPIAIIVAVLFFGGIWGVWGVFFAIPLATLVQAVIHAWPRKQVAASDAPTASG